MTSLVSKIDYFQILSMAQSIYIIWGRGKKVTAMLRRWFSRGLGTPEVRIPSVPGPALRGNKIALSNLAGQHRLKLLEIGEPEENERQIQAPG